MTVDVARVAFAQREFRTVKVEDISVQSKHPLATELNFTTFLSQQTDANAFGASVLSLLKLDRYNWRLMIRRDRANFSLGDTITIAYPRFGLDDGRNFIVKRIKDDYSSNYVEVALFGPELTAPRDYAPGIVLNTAEPVIAGTSVYDSSDIQTLTVVDVGTWSGAPTSYSYRWRRDGVDIAAAVGASYNLQAADVGASILCRVSATNGSGNDSADSNTIGPITSVGGLSPTNITPPTISGNPPSNLTAPVIS